MYTNDKIGKSKPFDLALALARKHGDAIFMYGAGISGKNVLTNMNARFSEFNSRQEFGSGIRNYYNEVINAGGISIHALAVVSHMAPDQIIADYDVSEKGHVWYGLDNFIDIGYMKELALSVNISNFFLAGCEAGLSIHGQTSIAQGIANTFNAYVWASMVTTGDMLDPSVYGEKGNWLDSAILGSDQPLRFLRPEPPGDFNLFTKRYPWEEYTK
jgi:hypothetical protein